MNAMRQKIIIAIVSFVTIGAVAIFMSTAVRAIYYSPDSEVDAPPVAVISDPKVGPLEYPSKLLIPALSIDARIKFVGVNEKGNMATPGNFTDVAWYKYGTVPGQLGSAVMAGHVDNGLGLAGVFKHLDTLKKGDDIYVETKEGTKLHFVVFEVKAYPYTDVPTDVLFTRSGKAYLNLVTCVGNWIKEGKTYDQRLIVSALLQ